MVYESDFYTTRRPYRASPSVSSYTVSTFVPSRQIRILPGLGKVHVVHSHDRIIPYIGHKRLTVVSAPPHMIRVRPSVIIREIDRIQHKARPFVYYSPTSNYLNSEASTLFDDETRVIRAKSAALLKAIHAPVPRVRVSWPVTNSRDLSTYLPKSSVYTDPLYQRYLIRFYPRDFSDRLRRLRYIPHYSYTDPIWRLRYFRDLPRSLYTDPLWHLRLPSSYYSDYWPYYSRYWPSTVFSDPQWPLRLRYYPSSVYTDRLWPEYLRYHYDMPLPVRITSDDYIHRMLTPIKNIQQDIYNISHYNQPLKRYIGKGHLSCVSYAGDKAYSRRRNLTLREIYAMQSDTIRNDIQLLSYYIQANKERKALEGSGKVPLPANRPSRIFTPQKMLLESGKEEISKELNELREQRAERLKKIYEVDDKPPAVEDAGAKIKRSTKKQEEERLAEERALAEEKAKKAEQAKKEEEARRAELARQEALAAQAAAERQAELDRKAEQAKKEEQAKQDELAKKAEAEKAAAELARIEAEKAEQARLEEEKRLAEQARLEEEKKQAELAKQEEERQQLLRLEELARQAEEEKERELVRQAEELAELARQEAELAEQARKEAEAAELAKQQAELAELERQEKELAEAAATQEEQPEAEAEAVENIPAEEDSAPEATSEEAEATSEEPAAEPVVEEPETPEAQEESNPTAEEVEEEE